MMLAYTLQITGNVNHPLVLFYRQPGSTSLQPVVRDYGERKVMVDSDLEREDETDGNSESIDESSDESEYQPQTEMEVENEEEYVSARAKKNKDDEMNMSHHENKDEFMMVANEDEMEVDNEEMQEDGAGTSEFSLTPPGNRLLLVGESMEQPNQPRLNVEEYIENIVAMEKAERKRLRRKQKRAKKRQSKRQSKVL
jgi:hypothetical protein